MTKQRSGEEAARRKFARAMARAEFGKFYMSECDVAELKQAARKKPKRAAKD